MFDVQICIKFMFQIIIFFFVLLYISKMMHFKLYVKDMLEDRQTGMHTISFTQTIPSFPQA